MDQIDYRAPGLTRKRKFHGEDDEGLRLDELNQDLLERILSWLPTSTFFRLSSVCKRWKSVAGSASFKLACSEVPTREPWFLMVGPSCQGKNPVVFDSADRTWKQLNRPAVDLQNSGAIPVASSGGLVCFRGQSGDFTVCNPVAGSSREIPRPDSALDQQPLHAIVMQSVSHHSFKLILVYGELPRISFQVFESELNQWEEEIPLTRIPGVNSTLDSWDDDNSAVYFLSKAGNVVATDMLRSPSKQYSSVLTVNKDGESIIYFLSSSGLVVACNLTKQSFTEYPRLLPIYSEYSVDIVECGGEMIVVVLAEFLESASLRMWRFDTDRKAWCQIAAMPPSMSHEFYSKKVDINCVGANNQVMICLSSSEICRYISYHFAGDEWVELPKVCVDGEDMEFMSAFSFEPRIEASV